MKYFLQPALMHVSVCSLSLQNEHEVNIVQAALVLLQQFSLPYPSPTILVQKIGALPLNGPPSVVYLGISEGEGAQALTRLHDILVSLLNTCEVTVIDHPYTPHITIGTNVRKRVQF